MEKIDLIAIVAAFLWLVILYVCNSCAFEKDYPTGDTLITEGATKYRTIHTESCGIKVRANYSLNDPYRLYWGNWFRFSVRAATAPTTVQDRSVYSTPDNLQVGVACKVCEYDPQGVIYLIDSKFDAIPAGCGPERPPPYADSIVAEYLKPSSSEWSDVPPKTFRTEFVPQLVADPQVCDNLPVVMDLTPMCEILVEAGVMERR